MVVLGALLARRPALTSLAAVEAALERAVSARHRELNEVNRKALKQGYEASG
jgi:Pyruvate/2-oxoacid:ferredoxin oxidoreductase gamma subunit